MNNMKVFLYRLLQWTWGFPQTLCGFIKYLKLKNYSHEEYNGAIITRWPRNGGISLGMYIFVEESNHRYNQVKHHEYGHTIQSLILGPLYLFVVGVPSYIWCNLKYFRNYRSKNNVDYSELFCEKWADKLGAYIEKKENK